MKLVNIPQIEIPEIIEKKEIKILEKDLPSLKKEEKIKSPKEKIIEKKLEFTEKFSPEEYKKKLYSKISNIEQQTNLPSKPSSQNINIKIPEIKSIQINTPTFESYSDKPSFITEIPSWYINIIRKKIEENWLLKEYLIGMSAIVSFRIYRDGKVENVYIEKSSGYKKFDNSIIEAIKSVKNWPNFPEEIKDRYLDIIIEFKTEG
ncbi:MAG: TonB family protein [Candidatus Omnitrophica bacterium]|nr:TonB family protein [Candidatus Omnitrophota bacterium]MCM8808975.1 TonB family protein [Candidatus Omnitrophota bacterium]MCM8810740.1 TonB family protein [Candidatus Omnitrophota bacterium]